MPSMALAGAAPEAITARKGDSPQTGDPFWNSTTRASNASLTALMSAIQQVVPPPTATVTAAPPRARSGGRRPNCTHMDVVRAHGELVCSMCYRVPDFKWVYQCRQDRQPHSDSPLPDIDSMPVVPDDSDYFDAKARVADHLKMSPSIIKGIRNGDYDVDQVDKLIKQREKVIQIITEQENPTTDSQSYCVRNSFSDLSIIASAGATFQPLVRSLQSMLPHPMTPAGTPANTPHHSKVTTPTKQDSVVGRPLQPNCSFQVCPACRFYFQDRLWTSFEAVFNGELAPITEDELKTLPMINPNLALNIGLRTPPPPSMLRSPQSLQSMDIARYDGEDASTEISVDWTHSTVNGEDDSGSDHLDNADFFPCPGPLQCPVWSRHSGCAYDAGFDDGRRVENHGFTSRLTPENSRSRLRHLAGLITSTPCDASSTASSISLPTPQTAPLTPLLSGDDTFEVAMQKQLRKGGKARSVCGELSAEHHKIGLRDKESRSSMGGEVEVAGGVALTEEAVESRVPDIVDE